MSRANAMFDIRRWTWRRVSSLDACSRRQAQNRGYQLSLANVPLKLLCRRRCDIEIAIETYK